MKEQTYKEVIIELSNAISETFKTLMNALKDAWDNIVDYAFSVFKEPEKKPIQSMTYWKNPKHDARINSQVLINKPLRVCARTNC